MYTPRETLMRTMAKLFVVWSGNVQAQETLEDACLTLAHDLFGHDSKDCHDFLASCREMAEDYA